MDKQAIIPNQIAEGWLYPTVRPNIEQIADVIDLPHKSLCGITESFQGLLVMDVVDQGFRSQADVDPLPGEPGGQSNDKNRNE
jgi:hypothetical protein